MSRTALEVFERSLEAAYRGDPFHALRRNLKSVTPETWAILPANPSVGPNSEFGPDPELSICDIVRHVAGAKHMYANHIFGDGSMQWGDLRSPGDDMDSMLKWLDEGHQLLSDGLAGLADDSELAVERKAPWKQPLRTEHLLLIIINHDLYHSGEINRQRGLIVGADGWERGSTP